ncbi:hypothetical protein [Dyella sp.]|nr:hypothetical protein [Dyella sp.]MDR3443678.1 hypothetical protein [Dyella sp.]PMQ03772.1 hypothetical protein DyAD56_17830 [Dyella sp. AD56]
MATFKGAAWSARMHANVGWTQTSRQALSSVLANVAIPNRNQLPPHCYLTFAGQNPAPMALKNYLKVASWVDSLRRPTGAGFGLTALNAIAGGLFGNGHFADSLIAQIEHGGVSVEIYYVSGYEV